MRIRARVTGRDVLHSSTRDRGAFGWDTETLGSRGRVMLCSRGYGYVSWDTETLGC